MVRNGSGACDACGADAKSCLEANALGAGASTLPDSWFVRSINGRDYTLCDCCGAFVQFKGGMSPYLQDALGLNSDARCDDIGEVKAMVAARAKRRKDRLRND